MTLLIAMLLAFALASVAWYAPRVLPRSGGVVLALAVAGLFAFFAAQAPAIAAGGLRSEAWPWIPSLGVELTLRLDAWSLLFALLITGIGAAVVLYASKYLHGHPHLGPFYTLLLAFMASMLGLVLSDNLLAMFVFWELTSLTSYLLIGFEHREEASRSAALMGLLITVGGGQALLAGLLLLGIAGGTFDASALSAALTAHPLYPAIVLLILAGAFTKSAQVPFHFWLPGAMAAPTPVSAYLHSATMVKAGIYLLARLNPALGGTALWTTALSVVGATTMLTGAALALRQTDLKRLLAFATVSVLGALTLLIGLGTPAALLAAGVFLLAHALYKGSLFLVAGAVDHGTGSRDLTQLGGLGRAMPWTAAATLLAVLAMAGLPPAFGFIGKELVYEAALGGERWTLAVFAVTALAFVAIVAVSALLLFGVFFGRETRAPHAPHEARWQMLAGPVGLAFLGLVFGLFPGTLDGFLTQLTRAIHPDAVPVHLALWHGFTPALGLSLVSLALGLLVYRLRGSLLRRWRAAPLHRFSATRAWERGLDAFKIFAAAQTRWIQSGYLRRYVLITVLVTTAGVAFALVTRAEPRLAHPSTYLEVHELVLAALTLAAAAAAAASRSRLGAVAAMGIVGFGVALFFLYFGAPDLALTQAIVEALTVVVFALALLHLPRFEDLSPRRTRLRDAVISLGFGGVMTALVLRVSGPAEAREVSRYYLEQSVPEAHGRNVVNVILVDFRALDTLGEITVLAVAAIGVAALLRLRPGTRASEGRRP